MESFGGGCCNHIASHVDDLPIAAKELESIMNQLRKRFTIKGGDIPDDCLGLTLKVTKIWKVGPSQPSPASGSALRRLRILTL